jgi:hypothetical protein
VRVDGSNLRFGNSFNAPQDRLIDRVQVTDNVYWQRGTHRLRWGGEWEYLNGRGRWAFLEPGLLVLHDPRNVQLVNQLVAQVPLPPTVRNMLAIPLPPIFTRPDRAPTLAEMLQLPLAVAFVGLGDPSQPPPFRAASARRNHRVRIYGQDSWTIRRRFTLTYGLSYQYETNLLNHDLPKPALLGPLVGRLDPPGKDKDNLAPSFGFAWDIDGRGRTVLRGGAGRYYDTILFVTRLTERGIIGPLGTGRVPISSSFFRNPFSFPQVPGLLPPLNQINPPLGAPLQFTSIPTKFTGEQFLRVLALQLSELERRIAELGRSGVTGLDFFKTGSDLLDPNLEVAYAEHISLGIGREFPHQMQLSADVVLRLRRHTLFQTDRNLYNRAEARGGAVIPRCLGAQATDPTALCSNGPISIYQSSGRERYLALLLKLDKRLSHRYQFTVSYALSSLTGYFPTEDLTDWFAYRGPLDRDARHRLTVSAIVDLPWGLRASLIAVSASSPPLNARVRGNIDLNGDGTFGDTLPGLKINSLGRGTSRAELERLVERFNCEFAGREDAHGAPHPPTRPPAAIHLRRFLPLAGCAPGQDLPIPRALRPGGARRGLQPLQHLQPRRLHLHARRGSVRTKWRDPSTRCLSLRPADAQSRTIFRHGRSPRPSARPPREFLTEAIARSPAPAHRVQGLAALAPGGVFRAEGATPRRIARARPQATAGHPRGVRTRGALGSSEVAGHRPPR